MSRLTRTDISMAIDMLYHPSSCDESDIRKAVADAITGLKELQHYKDLEEAGRLIELPCKVGDTVWKISTEQDSYDEPPYKIIRPITFRIDCLHAMGENIFTTKEEAEVKLKEIEGE